MQCRQEGFARAGFIVKLGQHKSSEQRRGSAGVTCHPEHLLGCADPDKEQRQVVCVLCERGQCCNHVFFSLWNIGVGYGIFQAEHHGHAAQIALAQHILDKVSTVRGGVEGAAQGHGQQLRAALGSQFQRQPMKKLSGCRVGQGTKMSHWPFRAVDEKRNVARQQKTLAPVGGDGRPVRHGKIKLLPDFNIRPIVGNRLGPQFQNIANPVRQQHHLRSVGGRRQRHSVA